ncbi:hypothetical protein BMETH_1078_0 [methanotrophic bacterial endosymbiont of Bathymodiolus sp.]|nr:hypothetical protein BMETH_1078_0 [methanotrophic bacterial endosymbiont of Bathymodiolus sp.]
MSIKKNCKIGIPKLININTPITLFHNLKSFKYSGKSLTSCKGSAYSTSPSNVSVLALNCVLT